MTSRQHEILNVVPLEALVTVLRSTVYKLVRDGIPGHKVGPHCRFQRLVHDLAAELGKEAYLVTEGVETGLDKSILDPLGDPLVHCLRNCLDHGVEPPGERLARGKPQRATIRLSAVHTGSNVVISIWDDGCGIDRAAVRAKAVAKQIIAADAILSNQEIANLTTMPGFSTATRATGVCRRGVGLDAVKRQAGALRGTLSLTSEEGKSTCGSITLPLTGWSRWSAAGSSFRWRRSPKTSSYSDRRRRATTDVT